MKVYFIKSNEGTIWKEIVATEKHILIQRFCSYWIGQQCPVFRQVDADNFWRIFSKNGFEIIELEATL